jgi:GT2 family glycosyltransferase
MPSMPRLSVIIVTFNSRAEIDSCLRSVMDGSRIDREIVVVDNASPDGTAAHVREHWPGVRLIELGANLGFARAMNTGIRQTFGELVLLLNPDASVPPGAIDRLVAALDRDPQAAVAGPRIVDAHGHAELSFGRMISPITDLWQKTLSVGSTRRWPVVTTIVERRAQRTKYVDWVTGACLLAYRADLEAVGLLDERFFLYTEDVDLCASMRARGRRVLFTSDVEVRHQRGASAAPPARESAYRRSYLAFYQKHHPAWVPVLRLYLRLFRRGASGLS